MPQYDQKKEVFITCPKGLSSYLIAELAEMGINAKEDRAGVHCEASLFDCMKFNLHLRFAHRVLFPLFEGEATHLEELYCLCKEYDWDEWIAKDGKFSVQHTAKDVDIDNTLMINLKAKDAVADYFVAKHGKRPDSGKAEEAAVISIRWTGKRVQVYMDTSGESLNRRGYKRDNWKAALQETLAAAIVKEAGLKPNTIIHNPMCGSGTIILEGLMQAYNVAPAVIRRDFAIMYLKDFPKDLWSSLRRMAAKKPAAPFQKMYASDRSTGAIKAARKNAHKLGMDNFIYWEVCDFKSAKTAPKEVDRLFLFNPPYGERLGNHQGLIKVYRDIGDYLKNQVSPCRAAVISSDEMLLRAIGIKPERVISMHNSKIPVFLHIYELN